MSVAEIDDTTPNEWLDIFDAYQVKTHQDNQHTGLICATVFNSQRHEKQDKVWKVEDFFPRYKARVTPVENDDATVGAYFDKVYSNIKTNAKLRQAEEIQYQERLNAPINKLKPSSES